MKYEEMFDYILQNYIGTEYKIELLEGAQPYYAKKISILKVHEATLNTEVDK